MPPYPWAIREAVRPGFFIDAAGFIKGFADGCHHKKEEEVLFVSMLAHGLPTQGGPVQVMLSEHVQGRKLAVQMREGAHRWEAGDPSGRLEVISAAKNFVVMLRSHIYKENNILFPMAERVIPSTEHQQISDDFELVEHEEIGEGVHEKYLALTDKLEKELAG